MTHTAVFFTYKGNLAVEIDMKGKFINDPTKPGQIGCVITASEVGMTPMAKDMIRKAKRAGGSFSELMLMGGTEPGKASIGVLGFGKVHYGKDFKISRDCHLAALEDCETIAYDAPEDYMNMIDKKKS